MAVLASLDFNIKNFDYVEHILLLSSSSLEIQNMLQRVFVADTLIGLKISIEEKIAVINDESYPNTD
jgi:hypothetical protein